MKPLGYVCATQGSQQPSGQSSFSGQEAHAHTPRNIFRPSTTPRNLYDFFAWSFSCLMSTSHVYVYTRMHICLALFFEPPTVTDHNGHMTFSFINIPSTLPTGPARRLFLRHPGCSNPRPSPRNPWTPPPNPASSK